MAIHRRASVGRAGTREQTRGQRRARAAAGGCLLLRSRAGKWSSEGRVAPEAGIRFGRAHSPSAERPRPASRRGLHSTRGPVAVQWCLKDLRRESRTNSTARWAPLMLRRVCRAPKTVPYAAFQFRGCVCIPNDRERRRIWNGKTAIVCGGVQTSTAQCEFIRTRGRRAKSATRHRNAGFCAADVARYLRSRFEPDVTCGDCKSENSRSEGFKRLRRILRLCRSQPLLV